MTSMQEFRELRRTYIAARPAIQSLGKFRALKEKHRAQLDVLWSVDARESDCLYFHSFINRSLTKGNGAKALREVCALADKLELHLRLDCIVPKLFSYYAHFEFVCTYSHDGFRSFHRQPQTKESRDD